MEGKVERGHYVRKGEGDPLGAHDVVCLSLSNCFLFLKCNVLCVLVCVRLCASFGVIKLCVLL